MVKSKQRKHHAEHNLLTFEKKHHQGVNTHLEIEHALKQRIEKGIKYLIEVYSQGVEVIDYLFCAFALLGGIHDHVNEGRHQLSLIKVVFG